ncbi:MAG: aminotransferase class I/II-fold pyridoxal phosphate-dependent enzyme [Methylococcales bacterium]|nr:aminotransferase class I/II-fold pyridoxal phosphate-dependent enzyme [Methylococcales bacterium]
MTLLEKLDHAAAIRKAMLPDGLAAFGMPVDEIYSASEARVGDQKILFFGTNNYLGLTFAPECLDAAHKALNEEGTGTTGSRLANGNYHAHRLLEQEFAEFYGCDHAMVFTTGYQANLGVISGLAGPEDTLVIDADSHASIYDGCKLSGANVVRFRHNDVDDLDKRLRRLGERAQNCLIIVEGIYSMLGDKAKLADMVAVKNRYRCLILVDEAHSIGVLGDTGQGLVEETGVLDQVDFITGTFSKSLGSIGGYCVSRHAQLEQLRYLSRPYIFTASPSPATIASTRAALTLLREGQALRLRLWRNANRLYRHLHDLGLRLGPDPGPIIAVIVDHPAQALQLWQGLLERGIYVNLILPPAAPDDQALVRISISAAHTDAQIDAINQAFSELKPML